MSVRTLGRIIGLTALAATVVGVRLVVGLPASGAPASVGEIVNARAPNTIKDRYIVVLKEGRTADSKAAAVAGSGIAVRHTYRSAVSGFSATMSEERAKQLAADPDVAYVEQDAVVRASTEQTNPGSWGLDRIDQRDLPLNNRYGYPDDGGSKCTPTSSTPASGSRTPSSAAGRRVGSTRSTAAPRPTVTAMEPTSPGQSAARTTVWPRACVWSRSGCSTASATEPSRVWTG